VREEWWSGRVAEWQRVEWWSGEWWSGGEVGFGGAFSSIERPRSEI
jgi:hypothetical protein